MKDERQKGEKEGAGECRNRALGSRGEERAADYLRGKGYRIIETNYRCRLGEIDLVAVEGETVVIVEVKSKSSRFRGAPEDMITFAKQRKLTALAQGYLQDRRWVSRPARFDVLAIDWSEEGETEIRHYRDAFPAAGGW